MGVPPVVVVLRDIGWYASQISKSTAIFHPVGPTRFAFADFDARPVERRVVPLPRRDARTMKVASRAPTP